MKKYDNYVGVIVMDGFGSSVDVGSKDRLHHMVVRECRELHDLHGLNYVWRYHRWAFFRWAAAPWMRRRIRRLHKKGVRRWVVVGFSFGAYRLLKDVIPQMSADEIFDINDWYVFIDPQNSLANKNDEWLAFHGDAIRAFNFYQSGTMGGYRVRYVANDRLSESHSSIRHHPRVEGTIRAALYDLGKNMPIWG